MPYKVCEFCSKTSYSAAESPTMKWYCPYCNKDISHVKGQTSLPQQNESDGK